MTCDAWNVRRRDLLLILDGITKDVSEIKLLGRGNDDLDDDDRAMDMDEEFIFLSLDGVELSAPCIVYSAL